MSSAPSKAQPGVGTCSLYFASSKPPPLPGGVLYLNGEEGIVNNACFPSEVGQCYNSSLKLEKAQ